MKKENEQQQLKKLPRHVTILIKGKAMKVNEEVAGLASDFEEIEEMSKSLLEDCRSVKRAACRFRIDETELLGTDDDEKNIAYAKLSKLRCEVEGLKKRSKYLVHASAMLTLKTHAITGPTFEFICETEEKYF